MKNEQEPKGPTPQQGDGIRRNEFTISSSPVEGHEVGEGPGIPTPPTDDGMKKKGFRFGPISAEVRWPTQESRKEKALRDIREHLGSIKENLWRLEQHASVTGRLENLAADDLEVIESMLENSDNSLREVLGEMGASTDSLETKEAWQDVTAQHGARVAAFLSNYFSIPEGQRLPYERENEMWMDAKGGRDLLISGIADRLTIVTKAELQLKPTKVMHIIMAGRHGLANIYLSGKALEDYFNINRNS